MLFVVVTSGMGAFEKLRLVYIPDVGRIALLKGLTSPLQMARTSWAEREAKENKEKQCQNAC